MLTETIPIIINLPQFDEVEIYPVHDMHFGSEAFDSHKWNELSKHILEKDNRLIVWVGDLMENAVPSSSHSDCFSQTATPREQQAFVESLFKQFGDRTLAIVDGNHEFNRSTRTCGLYPLYNAACIARIDERYRSAYAVLDIGIGNWNGRPSRAIGFVTHRAKDLRSFSSCDQLEGFDFVFCGHDHDPREHARAHLCYDHQRREVTFRSVEQVDGGSFMRYGGYGARSGYRPQSDKCYKLVVRAKPHRQIAIETVGFYV